ncbi:hypothetical protein GN244_ATG20306 [Phytophthora infestans]|uniref:Uncharacterized protein n=1 Tax=Phytophthora infestans TaxID=4787 RepID=A0A833W3D6_PHYIN|nr:hypothetical protein GN244_ATG20306 [Phytophthora infestans]
MKLVMLNIGRNERDQRQRDERESANQQMMMMLMTQLISRIHNPRARKPNNNDTQSDGTAD